jgi:hypothetical protein
VRRATRVVGGTVGGLLLLVGSVRAVVGEGEGGRYLLVRFVSRECA